ncbi:uncharacterized protein LOC126078331 [Elephas maximus indicus]|uniref:uncharacterized protein LOC126078331 n=1 Tax=Elephas maximus indicus TaxID=99487 RepID=UPI002116B0E1|nr:uncharacterized protein LOC126078331 [Elephas maximus indicus]
MNNLLMGQIEIVGYLIGEEYSITSVMFLPKKYNLIRDPATICRLPTNVADGEAETTRKQQLAPEPGAQRSSTDPLVLGFGPSAAGLIVASRDKRIQVFSWTWEVLLPSDSRDRGRRARPWTSPRSETPGIVVAAPGPAILRAAQGGAACLVGTRRERRPPTAALGPGQRAGSRGRGARSAAPPARPARGRGGAAAQRTTGGAAPPPPLSVLETAARRRRRRCLGSPASLRACPPASRGHLLPPAAASIRTRGASAHPPGRCLSCRGHAGANTVVPAPRPGGIVRVRRAEDP